MKPTHRPNEGLCPLVNVPIGLASSMIVKF